MIIMASVIYTLKAVARIEGVDPDYPRLVIYRLKKSYKPLEWRGYRFIKVEGKAYIAVLNDPDFQLIEE